MGCFSWMFADYANLRNLKLGEKGYLCCPDNQYLCAADYDGVGIFGGQDVYDLVADWNRKFLSQNPDFAILKDVKEKNKKLLPVSQAPWYAAYADLSKTREEVVDFYKQTTGQTFVEWRYIGIEIACYNEQNAKLRFPIKVTKTCKCGYDMLPASMSDVTQGCAGSSQYIIDDIASNIFRQMQNVDPQRITKESNLSTCFDETAEIKVQNPDGSCQVLFSCPFLASRKTRMDTAVFQKLRQYTQLHFLDIQAEKREKEILSSTPIGQFFLKNEDSVVWIYDVGNDPEIEPCPVYMHSTYSQLLDVAQISFYAMRPSKRHFIVNVQEKHEHETLHLFTSEDECRAAYANIKERLESIKAKKTETQMEIDALRREYTKKEKSLLDALQQYDNEISRIQKD